MESILKLNFQTLKTKNEHVTKYTKNKIRRATSEQDKNEIDRRADSSIKSAAAAEQATTPVALTASSISIHKMPSTSPTSVWNLNFWLLTVGLLLLWSAILATATPASASEAPVVNLPASVSGDKELKNTRNCKALCEHCGCLGFYCGEECICECNNENSDTECIATMQSNAKLLAIPFEVLIQGPSANRFVRNALQFEQNADRKDAASVDGVKNGITGRNKRSTVVIYKPAQQNALVAQAEQQKTVSKKSEDTSAASGRHKRSVAQLDWFSDLANTLVRPAPLRSAKKPESAVRVEEDEMAAQKKRSADELDRSWFTDSASKLLRPAPIFRRQQSSEDLFDNSPAMAKIPQVLKDTLRSIQEAAITDDFADALSMKFKDNTEVYQNRMQPNFEFIPRSLRNDIASTFTKLKMNRDDLGLQARTPPSPVPDQSPKYLIPWFRPARFLQRVQQAIN